VAITYRPFVRKMRQKQRDEVLPRDNILLFEIVFSNYVEITLVLEVINLRSMT